MSWLFIDTHAQGQFRVGWLSPEQISVRNFEGRAHGLLPVIESIWSEAKIEGVCVVAGPGRFSAIRTGVLDANLIADWYHVSLVGITVTEADRLDVLARELATGLRPTQAYVAPVYDAEPNITFPTA